MISRNGIIFIRQTEEDFFLNLLIVTLCQSKIMRKAFVKKSSKPIFHIATEIKEKGSR